MAKLIGYRKIAVCLSVGALLTGCGVRGALEYPEEYPDREQAAQSANANSGQGKPKGEAPKTHEGFILDKLIQ